MSNIDYDTSEQYESSTYELTSTGSEDDWSEHCEVAVESSESDPEDANDTIEDDWSEHCEVAVESYESTESDPEDRNDTPENDSSEHCEVAVESSESDPEDTNDAIEDDWSEHYEVAVESTESDPKDTNHTIEDDWSEHCEIAVESYESTESYPEDAIDNTKNYAPIAPPYEILDLNDCKDDYVDSHCSRYEFYLEEADNENTHDCALESSSSISGKTENLDTYAVLIGCVALIILLFVIAYCVTHMAR